MQELESIKTLDEMQAFADSLIESNQFQLAITYHEGIIAWLQVDKDVVNLVDQNISFCSELVEHGQHDEAIRLASEFSNLIENYYDQDKGSMNWGESDFDLSDMHNSYYEFIDFLVRQNQLDLAHKYCITFLQFEAGDKSELSKVCNKLGSILIDKEDYPEAFNAFCKSVRCLIGNDASDYSVVLANSFNKLKLFYQEGSDPFRFFQFASGCYDNGRSTGQQLPEFLDWVKKSSNSQTTQILSLMVDHLELLLQFEVSESMDNYLSNPDNVKFVKDQMQQLKELNSIFSDDTPPLVAAARALKQLSSENESLISRMTVLESRLNEMKSAPSTAATDSTTVFFAKSENQIKRALSAIDSPETNPRESKRQRTLDSYLKINKS